MKKCGVMDQWLELSLLGEKIAGSTPSLSVWSLHVLQIWIFSRYLAGLAFSYCCVHLSYCFSGFNFNLQFVLSEPLAPLLQILAFMFGFAIFS